MKKLQCFFKFFHVILTLAKLPLSTIVKIPTNYKFTSRDILVRNQTASGAAHFRFTQITYVHCL